jgi:phosphoglycerate dehydrogenase-like enzyme
MTWLPPGVVVTTNRGVATRAGEYVAMAVLAINSQIPHFASCKQSHRWDRRFSSGIAGKTVVVVGMGNLGRSGAHECKKLGMTVIGVRHSAAPETYVDEMYAADQLGMVLPRADFLVVALPLTSQTRGMIGSTELDLLKPSAGVINIGRGPVIDQMALGAKLVAGEIAGAILDVFDEEPLSPNSPIWDWPNCIVTPHVAADDVDRYIPDTLDLFFSNIRRYFEGRDLVNQVDAARGY